MNRSGQEFTILMLVEEVMLAMGAAFRHTEERFGQQFHTVLQKQCNSLEKNLDSFLSKDAVVTNTQSFAKGLSARFGW